MRYKELLWIVNRIMKIHVHQIAGAEPNTQEVWLDVIS